MVPSPCTDQGTNPYHGFGMPFTYGSACTVVSVWAAVPRPFRALHAQCISVRHSSCSCAGRSNTVCVHQSVITEFSVVRPQPQCVFTAITGVITVIEYWRILIAHQLIVITGVIGRIQFIVFTAGVQHGYLLVNPKCTVHKLHCYHANIYGSVGDILGFLAAL